MKILDANLSKQIQHKIDEIMNPLWIAISSESAGFIQIYKALYLKWGAVFIDQAIRFKKPSMNLRELRRITLLQSVFPI